MGWQDEDDIAAETRAYNRRQNLKALGFFGGVVLLIAALILAVVWWPTAAKDLVAARTTLEARRAQYCKVFEAVRALPMDHHDLSRPGERVVLPGYVWLDAADIASPNPGANADGIETGELAKLCGSDMDVRRPELFHSLLGELALDPRDPRVSRYERAGVALGLEVLAKVRYLLVYRVRHHRDSSASGEHALAPGATAGSVCLFRLEDTRAFGCLPVDIDAPGSAYVMVRRDAYGQARRDDLDLAVRADSSSFFRDAIARRFKDRGVELVIREEDSQ